MKKIMVAAAISLLSVHAAQAAVATFDEYTSSFQGPTSFSSGPLTFTQVSGGSMGVWTTAPSAGPFDGTSYLLDGYQDAFQVTATGGGAFSLDSFSAALGWYTDALTSGTINVTYTLAGGGTSSATYTVTDSFTTFSPGLDVTSATFDMNNLGGYISLDNVVVNASTVPEPDSAALMLAGLALAGLAARRRLSRRG